MKSTRKPRKSLSTNNLKEKEDEQLSLVLMPKNKWVPDNQSPNCFSCNKSFIPFVRRKHHCRRCGNIFCNTCCQNFLLGSEIGLNDKEKKIRFCDYCFQGYQNFLKLKKNSLKDRKNSSLKDGSDAPESFHHYLLKEKEENSASNIKHRVFFTETTNIPLLQEKHKEIVNKRNEELISYMFKKYNIYDKWFKLLFELIEKSVRSINHNLNRANFMMDINKFVKIKKIPYEDESLTKSLNGVVCRKNIIDKKMKNKFLSPRILVATQIELVENADLTVFENLIQNEKKQIKKIVDKIRKMAPNVILVEKSINRLALEYFKEDNIIIIVKIKHNLLKRIARVTKATIIKNLNMLEKLPEDKILGTCDKFYIKKFFVEGYKTNKLSKMGTGSESDFKNEDTSNDPNYLFIEVMSPFLGTTLLISGPNEEELKVIKECVKLCLKLMRHFILEREIVTNEVVLINQINHNSEKQKKKETSPVRSESFGASSDKTTTMIQACQKNIHQREGDFSKYLFEKMSFEELFTKRSIHFTKVCYAKSSWENSNEICANEEAVKYFYQLFGDKKKKNEKSSHVDFLEICELPSSVKIEHYSDEDFALGQYLILRVNNLNSRCENCKRPRYQHFVYYYFNHVYVKIACELTGMLQVQTFNIEEQMLRQSSEVGPNELNFEMNRDAVTQSSYSLVKELGSPLQKSFTNNTPKISRQNTRITANNTPIKFDIKSYIECDTCRSILTKETQLSQNYLEYSFTRYLEHFFLNNNPHDISEEPKFQNSNKCEHKMKNRVFDYNGVLIKMSSGLCKFYHLEKIKDVVNDSDAKNNLEIIRNNLILLKKEDFKIKIRTFSNELIRILENASNSVNENTTDKTIDKEKKNLVMLQSLHQNSQIHLNESDPKISTELQGDFDDFDENEDDENDFYQLLEHTHTISNVENSIDYADMENYSTRGIEYNEHKIDAVESFAEGCFDELKNVELSMNDKSVVERKSMYKNLKIEFAKSAQYSENINKANGHLETFLNLIKAKVSDLTNSFLNHCNKTTFKSYLNVEYFRYRYIRKISELLTIIHFITHKKDKKIKNKGQGSMQSSKKIIENMKTSIQINQIVPVKPANEEDDIYSHSDHMNIKILNTEETNENKPDLEEDNSESPENISKMLEDTSFKALTYTPLFQSLYNEMNRGKAFVDNKEASFYRGLQKFKTIPVSEDEPLSLVAHALNSCQYMKEVFVKSDFHELEKKMCCKMEKDWRKNSDIYSCFEKILDETELTEKNATFTLRSYINVNSKSRITTKDPQNLEANSTEFEESINLKKFKAKFCCEKAKVTVYYPSFFEALRLAYGIPLSDFIQSLALNNQWKENSGGKSKAKFIKSYDELYIIKQLQKNEFFMIDEYAKSFFNYMWKILNGEIESIMTKIFGLYEISINNVTYYYMVMENLFYGLKTENFTIFDLKGSETNRFVKKTKIGQTLLDTNFKLERNNEPLALIDKDFKFFKKARENDSNFLSDHNLIDYSLLLIIDEKNMVVRMGIIDFLRIYTWDKQLEHMGKIVINAGAIPTITNPDDYRERFINALKKYFMDAKTN